MASFVKAVRRQHGGGPHGSTFTFTAIPKPSTYVAAIALLALMLWPLCRRLRGKVS